MLTEISVALEDKAGELSKVLVRLNEKYINILAFSIDQSENDSTVRFICDEPDDAYSILNNASYKTKAEKVLGIKVPHRPSALYDIAHALFREEINIEYAYLTLVPKSEEAIIILKLSSTRTSKQFKEIFGEYGEVIDGVKGFSTLNQNDKTDNN